MASSLLHIESESASEYHIFGREKIKPKRSDVTSENCFFYTKPRSVVFFNFMTSQLSRELCNKFLSTSHSTFFFSTKIESEFISISRSFWRELELDLPKERKNPRTSLTKDFKESIENQPGSFLLKCNLRLFVINCAYSCTRLLHAPTIYNPIKIIIEHLTPSGCRHFVKTQSISIPTRVKEAWES